MSVRMREALVVVLLCASLASCGRGGEPRPTHTLEPRLTESSAIPTVSPDNKACKLLSAEDRSTLPGYSMNVRVPVSVQAGTEECVWVHYRGQPARAAIRVVAFNARQWAPQAVDVIRAVLQDPSTTKSEVKKLKRALAELLRSPDSLPAERICKIYLLAQEARGLRKMSDLVYGSTIGSMPAVYAISCDNGILIMAGYGEYGIQSSLALQHAVVRLAEAANERAPDVFGNNGGSDEGKQGGEGANGSDAGTSSDTASPTAQPSSDASSAADETDGSTRSDNG
jgi:hypothetical protein